MATAAASTVPPQVFGRGGRQPSEASAPSSSFELRQYVERRRNALLDERKPYEPDWMQVSEYVDPVRTRLWSGNAGTTTANGNRPRRSRAKILNSTATECVRVAAAGFSSHMTSKSRPWFQVEAPDPSLNDNYDVRLWNDTVTGAVRDVLAKSNFYKAMPDAYTENIEFGVTAMLMPEDEEEIVRFHVLTAGTFAIGLNAQGRVDTLYREFNRTAAQLDSMYGRDNLPQDIREAITDRPYQYFQVCALIEKNPDERPGLGPLGLQADRYRPWREVTWITGNKDLKHGCLKVKGFYEQPFVAGRWSPLSDEIYSSSPCLDCLGDIKGLQYLEGQDYRLTDLLTNPPLGMPDSMRNTPASLAPGSRTFMPINQNGEKAGPLYEVNYNAVTVNQNKIRVLETRIRSSLFYSLFMMLASLDDIQRTATEIAERRDERAVVLGPTVEVTTDEMLDPVIVRVFRVLERRGMIPAAPPALANMAMKIEYTSILAQAMKAAGLIGIERYISFAASIVQATGDSSHFDKVDFDQAQDEFSSRVGAPATIVRSDEAVAEIRAGRAQQQRAQQMAAMAKPAADAAKAYQTLAQTVPEEGSAAENLGAMLGGAT